MSIKPPGGTNNPTLTSNVIDGTRYGLHGDGVTDDTAALAAAFNAIRSVGGELVLPDGDFAVDTTSGPLFDLAANAHIVVRGGNPGHIVTSQTGITRIRRTAGTNPILRATGTGNNTRGMVTLRDLELNGNGGSGDVVRLTQCSEVTFDNVRLNNGTGYLLNATQLWNSKFRGCFFYAGGNGSTPATLIGAVSGLAGTTGSNTVHFSDCEWENNTGNDILIDGSVPDAVYSAAIYFTGCKFERQVASATYPVVKLGYCGRVSFSGGSIGAGGTGTTSKLFEMTSSMHTVDGFLSLAGVQMTQNASPDVYIDMAGGFLAMAGCALRDAPATAYLKIASGIGQDDVSLAGNKYASPGLAVQDNRAGASYPFAYGQLWETGLVGGAAHGTIGNFACVDLVDAASSGVAFAGRLDTRFLASTTTVLRVAYTSTVGGSNVRWQLRKLLPGTGTDLTGAGTATPVTDAAPATANQMKFVDLTVVGTANPGALQLFELRRLGADGADTNTGTVKVVSVDMVNARRL